MKRLIATTAAAVLAAGLALDASAVCKECGTVSSVDTVKKEGQASGAGAVLGGIAGGVLGHQVGSGRGNTAATVVGAGAGAYAGHQIEKNRNESTQHVVHVKMEDGSNRTFTYKDATSYRVGDKVKIVDKKLVRQ
jgi:outer membrane lipoprotein SlyB